VSSVFPASDEFAESYQATKSLADVRVAQVSGGVSDATIGGAVACGLVILSAFALLLLFKKKKKKVEEPEETGESTVGTITVDDFVSEYGMSDAQRRVDSDEDREDLPQETNHNPGKNSLTEDMSEHNPAEVSDDES
jgi:hypothetical protein